MKIKTLLAMGLCAAIGFFITSATAAEQEHGDHKDAHAKVKVPDTLPDIWKQIHAHHQQLKDVVKDNKLAEVHEHAFAVRDLAKALPAKSPPDHKKHIENLVKKVSQIAADLDKSGDAGDKAATEANLKKFDAALKSMEDMIGTDEAAPHTH
jgi:acetolactate synthase small subunit